MKKIAQTALLLTTTLASLVACGGMDNNPMQVYGAAGYGSPYQNAYLQYPNPVSAANQGFGTFAAQGSGKIKVHFVKSYQATIAENETITRRDPDGPAQALIRWIEGSRSTLDGSFYDIDSADVVNALLRARKRGVKVRLVTDTDNMTVKNGGPGAGPRTSIVQLQKAGIPVVEDKRSGIMHNKFLVIDKTVVWTGSTNLTDSSLYHHNNNALSLQSPEIVANYQGEFERLFTHKIFGPNPPRQVPYPVARVGSATVYTFFSPKGGGQNAVLQELQGARKNISFMTFSLTDKTAGSIIQQKLQQNVAVKGVFDTWLGAGRYSLFSPLQDAGVEVSKDGNEALLHHKVILVDDTVITGSYNYSANAENSNNENFLIIKNDAAVTKAYKDEFTRITNASRYNKRVRPAQAK